MTSTVVTSVELQSHDCLCLSMNSQYFESNFLLSSSTFPELFGIEFLRKLSLKVSAIPFLDETPFTTGAKSLLFLLYVFVVMFIGKLEWYAYQLVSEDSKGPIPFISVWV